MKINHIESVAYLNGVLQQCLVDYNFLMISQTYLENTTNAKFSQVHLLRCFTESADSTYLVNMCLNRLEMYLTLFESVETRASVSVFNTKWLCSFDTKTHINVKSYSYIKTIFYTSLTGPT